MLRCYGEREYTITVDRSFVSPALRTHSQDTFVTLKRVVWSNREEGLRCKIIFWSNLLIDVTVVCFQSPRKHEKKRRSFSSYFTNVIIV